MEGLWGRRDEVEVCDEGVDKGGGEWVLGGEAIAD